MGLFSPTQNMAPKAKAAATSRNPLLTKGVGRYSRTAMYTRSGRYAIKNKKITKKAEAAPAIKEKTIGGKQNGGKRTIAPKASRFYPADDVPRKLANSKRAKPTKLRASITPGTVLILLAGRFRGRRVVFLKQLASGLLLVTGPYAVNGVPLRRVNQRFCIATSTKVNAGDAGKAITDEFFARDAKKKAKKSESNFFSSAKKSEGLSDARKSAQKDADKVVKV